MLLPERVVERLSGRTYRYWRKSASQLVGGFGAIRDSGRPAGARRSGSARRARTSIAACARPCSACAAIPGWSDRGRRRRVAVITRSCAGEIVPAASSVAVVGRVGGSTSPVSERRGVSSWAWSARARASLGDRLRTPDSSRVVLPNPGLVAILGSRGHQLSVPTHPDNFWARDRGQSGVRKLVDVTMAGGRLL